MWDKNLSEITEILVESEKNLVQVESVIQFYVLFKNS